MDKLTEKEEELCRDFEESIKDIKIIPDYMKFIIL